MRTRGSRRWRIGRGATIRVWCVPGLCLARIPGRPARSPGRRSVRPKLADPLERYLQVAYGCNLSAAQAARHLRGLVSAHELGATSRRHVTLEQLNKAIAEVVNAYLALGLPKIWGSASSVAADGTKYEIYVDNLVAEYHIRYGGYGAIAHHHISDTYIALFTRFSPCGVWEAVYIIEGLLAQDGDAAPKRIHTDTQGHGEFPGVWVGVFAGVRFAAAYP